MTLPIPNVSAEMREVLSHQASNGTVDWPAVEAAIITGQRRAQQEILNYALQVQGGEHGAILRGIIAELEQELERGTAVGVKS